MQTSDGEGRRLWHDVLRLMGDDYAKIEAAVRDQYRPGGMDFKSQDDDPFNPLA